jgi:putative addiction module component (TIGR02574 family)
MTLVWNGRARIYLSNRKKLGGVAVNTYEAVLSAANQLPPADQLRLIDALWDRVPPEAEAPFSEEWLAEIDRRMDEFERHPEKTVPWSQVRDEAMTRLRRGRDR